MNISIKANYILAIYVFTIPLLHALPITQALINTASKELTPDESERVRRYVHDKIVHAKQIGDLSLQRKLEYISAEFSQAHYDIVLQQLRRLGENNEQLLHITPLRDQMLSGNFEQVAVYWLVQEVAAIDWLFAYDETLAIKRWPEAQNKVSYLANLVEDIRKNHENIVDVSILEDVINDLRTRLEYFKINGDASVKKQIDVALDKLASLLQCRIVEKKSVCERYVEIIP